MKPTEEPVHEQVDFVALAAVLTNEQRIVGALERIEQLLIARAAPPTASMSQYLSKTDLEAAKMKADPLAIPKALQRRK